MANRSLNPTVDTNFLTEWGVSHFSTLDFIARFNSYISSEMDLREAVILDMLKCNVMPSTKAGKDPEGFVTAIRERVAHA